jgi:competence protein ComEA
MNRLFVCCASLAFILCVVAVPAVRAGSTAEAESTGMQSTPPSGSMGSMEEKHETMKSETPKTTTHKAHVAKKPVPKVDINSASKEDLMKLGLPEGTAEKIVEGRPYKTKGELLTKKMLTSAQYRKIRARVIAKQGAAAATK